MDYDDEQDPFDKALGLPAPVKVITHTIEPLDEIIPEQNVEIKTFVQNDYEFARRTLRDIITTGVQLFTDAASTARQAETPEGYASSAQVMKTLVDANDKLVKLSESHARVTDNKKREIQREKEESEPGNVVNNNLIVTAAELQRMIQDMSDGNKKQED